MYLPTVPPLPKSIPGVATAPVLVLVGAMMMGESKHIDWGRMNVAVPAFLTMVIQPFTFSIANGIYAGLLFSILLFFLTGDFVPYFRELFGASEATDLEADLLLPPTGPLASPGGWSDRSTSRAPSMVGALHSATRMLSSNRPYNKTYDMLINTKGEPMPAEVRNQKERGCREAYATWTNSQNGHDGCPRLVCALLLPGESAPISHKTCFNRGRRTHHRHTGRRLWSPTPNDQL